MGDIINEAFNFINDKIHVDNLTANLVVRANEMQEQPEQIQFIAEYDHFSMMSDEHSEPFPFTNLIQYVDAN